MEEQELLDLGVGEDDAEEWSDGSSSSSVSSSSSIPSSSSRVRVEDASDYYTRNSSAITEPLPIDLIKSRLPLYVNKPALWAKEVVGYLPDKQQHQVLSNYISNRFTAVKSGHGTGKSCMLSIITLHFLATRHFSVVPSTAPSQHQLFDILWKEHSKWIRRSPFLSKLLEWTNTKVKVRGYGEEWHAVARTSRAKAGDESNVGLQGFHAGPHSGGILYAIDEASGVSESSMGAVEGAMSEKSSFIVMGGNPNHLSGTFYQAFNKDRDLWPGIYTLSCLKSEVVDPSYAERIARKYGKDSDTYRIKVLGEFPLSESEGLIPISYVEAAFDNDEETVNAELLGSYKRGLSAKNARVGNGVADNEEDEVTTLPVVGGLDVALQGDNRTCMFLRRGFAVFKVAYCSAVREEDIAAWAASLIREYNIKKLVVDCIGAGSGVASTLRTMGLGKLLWEYKSSNKPINTPRTKSKSSYTEDEQFVNIRAQAYWYVRTLFVNCAMALTYSAGRMDEDKLPEQLTAIRVLRSLDQGKVQIESKEHMRNRGMDSPDEADALVMCFALDILNRTAFKIAERLLNAKLSARDLASTLGAEDESALSKYVLDIATLSTVNERRIITPDEFAQGVKSELDSIRQATGKERVPFFASFAASGGKRIASADISGSRGSLWGSFRTN